LWLWDELIRIGDWLDWFIAVQFVDGVLFLAERLG
jgi:hypothetical protein